MSSWVHSSSSGEKTLDAGLAWPRLGHSLGPEWPRCQKTGRSWLWGGGRKYVLLLGLFLVGWKILACCWSLWNQVKKRRKIVSGTEIDSRTRMHSRNAFVCAICREEKGAWSAETVALNDGQAGNSGKMENSFIWIVRLIGNTSMVNTLSMISMIGTIGNRGN